MDTRMATCWLNDDDLGYVGLDKVDVYCLAERLAAAKHQKRLANFLCLPWPTNPHELLPCRPVGAKLEARKSNIMSRSLLNYLKLSRVAGSFIVTQLVGQKQCLVEELCLHSLFDMQMPIDDALPGSVL